MRAGKADPDSAEVNRDCRRSLSPEYRKKL